MADTKQTVLITGCSDGSAGAALAREFHARGYHVIATARSVSKMTSLREEGIETLELDITHEDSIQTCLEQVHRLDILVNTAGNTLSMPVVDLSISEAKKLFDINVWGHIAVIQAFLPLLQKSPKAVIVNHTSVGIHMVIPFMSAYAASKACMSKFTQALGLELRAFKIAVVELKSGGILTNLVDGVVAKKPVLPKNSIWTPARETVEASLSQEWAAGVGNTAEQWAREVAQELVKPNPPNEVWKGESATSARLSTFLPSGLLGGTITKMVGLDDAEQIIRARKAH